MAWKGSTGASGSPQPDGASRAAARSIRRRTEVLTRMGRRGGFGRVGARKLATSRAPGNAPRAARRLTSRAAAGRPRFRAMSSPSPVPGPTHFERLGGDAGIRRLVDRFYDLMDTAPEAAHVRG